MEHGLLLNNTLTTMSRRGDFMKKLDITNKLKKEKEDTLSLLRIPINYFSEEDPKKPTPVEDSNKKNFSPNLGATNNGSNNHIKISQNTPDKITISADIEFSEPSTEKKIDTSEPTITNSATSNTSKEPSLTYSPSAKEPTSSNANSTESSEKPENTTTPPSSSQPQQTTAPKEELVQVSNDNNENTNSDSAPKHSSPSAPSTPPPSQTTEKEPEEKTSSNEPVEKGTSSPDNSTDETDSDSNHKKDSEKTMPDPSQKEKSDAGNNSEKKDSKPKSPSKGSNDSKDARNKKAQELAKKYSGKPRSKDSLDAMKKNAQQKLADKGSQAASKVASDAASKAAPGALKTANNVRKIGSNLKEGIQEGNEDKLEEAAGDVAKEVGKGVANYFGGPVAGEAIEKLSETEAGKKVKKAVGKITVGSVKTTIKTTCACCGVTAFLLVAIVMIPLLLIQSIFSWASGIIFGKNNTDELSNKERDLLSKAAIEHSMQDYTDLTLKLYESNWLEDLFGTKPKYPLQYALESYLNEHYKYSKKQADDYLSEYDSLIEKGYLMKIKEGDLTSFGMAFDSLKLHYTISNLKAPSSAPKKYKDVNGEKVSYITADPSGTHEALFEEVLNKMDDLKIRFDDQVDPKWFDGDKDISNWDENSKDWDKISLKTILDTEVENVYIKDFGEARTLSLRTLLKDISVSYSDTEYHTSLVSKIFTTSEPGYDGNAKMAVLLKQLQKKLAMLELMTYMTAYYQYYEQIEAFVETNSGYDNISMFDGTTEQGKQFWAQFLTFSNVEHYMALASTSEHSLAYEIAVASINTTTNAIDIYKYEVGGETYIGLRKFENWYATYTFDPQVTISKDGSSFNYSLSVSDAKPTAIQEHLFTKYNVYSGLYDSYEDLTEEERSLKNQQAFFALFESATGIQMSYDENGNVKPKYEMLDLTPLSKVFPIDTTSTDSVTITTAYGQLYSQSTVARFGLSHNDHTGIDYAVPIGTPVVATSSGTAYVTRGNTGYGNYVKVIHDDGYTSIYAHGNGTFFVNNGSRVTGGQLIMESGNSGNSTGPHLHFEVRNPAGSHINPNSYLHGNA